MEYQDFLETKKLEHDSTGMDVDENDIHEMLKPFQRKLTAWAIRKGRAALFADTGLGKSFMQIEWARLIGGRSIIIAPLSVARQTVKEGAKIGVDIHYTRDPKDLHQINITNYEMINKFNAGDFNSVVLDESSILKSLTGKTKALLIEKFHNTKYRLCCTATPAPNDIAEIANHTEFLGIMTRNNMLSTFFVHDQDGWRLKGHSAEAFYRWMASWGMSVKKPSDLGFDDTGYILPPLNINPIFVDADFKPDGMLFWNGLKGITERAQVRKGTAELRIKKTAEIVNGDVEQWIVWCGMNTESTGSTRLIDGAVEVKGADSPEKKAETIEAFQDGKIRVLVTKPKIAGMGMNFQHCHNMAYLGLSDSFESYYQSARRCWRFGQHSPVNVHVVLSDAEKPIWENVKRKEREAEKMTQNLIAHVSEIEKREIGVADIDSNFQYQLDKYETDRAMLMLGDSAERMSEIESESVGLSIFSPPFISLYTYSPTERDIGNCKNEEEFFYHFGFIIDELMRVTQLGRNCCVHVAQVPAMLVRDGYIGMKDFRGETINAFEDRGWVYHGEVVIDKCPQAQSIRTHSKGLTFSQLKKDSSWLRPALADYILVFRKPGDNQSPIIPDITNNDWIEWARPIWYGIKETETLNKQDARENDDERHICPLQLGTIERTIRLWSNHGDLICSPFAGIGSEGYQSLKFGRRFVGIELKKSYFDVAVRNLEDAENAGQQTLFSMDAA